MVIIYAVLSFHKYGTAGVIVLWNFSSTQLWIAKSVGIFKIFCHSARNHFDVTAQKLKSWQLLWRQLWLLQTNWIGFEHKCQEDLNVNTKRVRTQIPRGFEHKYQEDLNTNMKRIWAQIRNQAGSNWSNISQNIAKYYGMINCRAEWFFLFRGVWLIYADASNISFCVWQAAPCPPYISL